MNLFGFFKSKEQRQFNKKKQQLIDADVKFGDFSVNQHLIVLPRNFMIEIDSLSPTVLPLAVIAAHSKDFDLIYRASRICAIESNCFSKSDIDKIATRYVNVATIIDSVISEFFPLIKRDEYITTATYLLIKNLKDKEYLDIAENDGKLLFAINDNFHKGIFKNDFGVRIAPCYRVDSSNNIYMRHGDQYSIFLFNDNKYRRANVDVYIDSAKIGRFRIECHSGIKIEHPVNDTGRFTFYEYGTREGFYAGVKRGIGFITCRFFLEKPEYPEWHFSLCEGGTGLSGQSEQMFTEAKHMNVEDSFTEIKLRLVSQKEVPHRIKSV